MDFNFNPKLIGMRLINNVYVKLWGLMLLLKFNAIIFCYCDEFWG
jgi:hypothetical protein